MDNRSQVVLLVSLFLISCTLFSDDAMNEVITPKDFHFIADGWRAICADKKNQSFYIIYEFFIVDGNTEKFLLWKLMLLILILTN